MITQNVPAQPLPVPAGRPAIALPVAAIRRRHPDNSFLIEEAYNQERGVIQHINSFARLWNSKDWAYTFTQEWSTSSPSIN
jgi:hypothetical protein